MRYDIHLHLHGPDDELIDEILRLARLIVKDEAKIMATIDDVLSDVQAESTLDDSIIALLNSVQAQLATALSGQTIPADVQAKIDAVFSGLEANKAKVAAAVTANTPASAPPTA